MFINEFCLSVKMWLCLATNRKTTITVMSTTIGFQGSKVNQQSKAVWIAKSGSNFQVLAVKNGKE